MAGVLRIYELGKYGVVLDSDDLHTPAGTWRSAKNLHVDPLGSSDAVVNRSGLTPFNTSALAGAVLGGIGVPLEDRTTGAGERRVYIIRAGS